MVPAGPDGRAQGRAQDAAGGLHRDDPPARLRGWGQLGQDRLGGRHRQRSDPAHGVLLGDSAQGDALVEPGRNGAGGRPVEAAKGVAGSPATGGVQAARPFSDSRAQPGLRLLAGPDALGLRRQEPTHRSRAAAIPGSGLQRLQRREGLSRKPQVSRRGRADTRVVLPVLLLAYRRHPQPLEEAHRQPARTMGGTRWKEGVPT